MGSSNDRPFQNDRPFLDDSVAAIAGRVRSGEQTARSLVEQALAAIDEHNPTIGAFVAIDAEAALAQADDIDRRVVGGEPVGALAGVPMGVKDLEAVKGFTTTFGSYFHRDDPPAVADSIHVGRYRAADAVIIGKTNTPEFGHKATTDNLIFAPTANPWSPEHSPGGSSGGTAAAIAAGMIPLATGSDGGGSIRIPASLCGLAGFKPSTGRIPIPGSTMPGSGLLSVNGPMGRTTMDTAVALDVVVGPHPRDPFSLPHPRRSYAAAVATADIPSRVVWSPTFGHGTVDRQVAAVCAQAVEALARAGTEVIELDTVFDTDPLGPWLVLWAAARFKVQGHLLGTPEWDHVSESMKPFITYGATLSAEDHVRAQDAMYALNGKLEDAFVSAPLILCPTLAGLAPRLGDHGTIDGVPDPAWVQFTYGINLTRNPAGSVPAGLSAEGLPIGLQVIGRQQADAEVLAAMAILEDVIGFTGRIDRTP